MTQNVGVYTKCQLLKMLALKNYSKFKSKCAYINHSKSYYTCAFINVSAYKNTTKMHAHRKMSAPKLLLFGLGGLSTLLSFSVRLKFSFWRCCSSTFWSSSGICSQIRSAYMGGVSAVLARLVVPARHDENLSKCRHPTECRRPPTFWPFLRGKVKKLTSLKSVLSLPFKFAQNHKSCLISAIPLLGL